MHGRAYTLLPVPGSWGLSCVGAPRSLGLGSRQVGKMSPFTSFTKCLCVCGSKSHSLQDWRSNWGAAAVADMVGQGAQGTWGCAGGWSYLGALGLRSSCCPRCMTLATAIPLPAATETPFKRAPPNVKHWNPTGLVHLSWTPRLGWSAGPHHGATPPLRLSLSPSGFRGESATAHGDGRLLTLSFPRPCSRMLRAMRWACSLVLTRLMLNAMRNFRAPVAVAPQLGTKELGPKSGAHSACLSCGETHPRLWCPPQERRPSKIREGGGHPPLQSAALHPARPGEETRTFSRRASYSPARMAGRVRRLAVWAASP